MTTDIDQKVWILRYILLVTSAFSVFTRFVISAIDGPTFIHPLRFFTLQSNLMVFIWIALSILWKNDDKYEKLTGFVKGALTTYISITWLVFMLLIEPIYDPVGIDLATSIFNHYLNPWMFIIDFILSEKKRFQWRWPVIWLVYPFLYLFFALIWGAAYGEYLYFFVNVKELGVGGLLIWVAILTFIFYVFGALYTFISRKYLAQESNS